MRSGLGQLIFTTALPLIKANFWKSALSQQLLIFLLWCIICNGKKKKIIFLLIEILKGWKIPDMTFAAFFPKTSLLYYFDVIALLRLFCCCHCLVPSWLLLYIIAVFHQCSYQLPHPGGSNSHLKLILLKLIIYKNKGGISGVVKSNLGNQV